MSAVGVLATRAPRPEVALGWVAAAGTVLSVYVVVVLGGGLLIGRLDSPHVGLSVLATAVVASIVEPVRNRAERRAARRFRRPDRTPYEVLAEFSQEMTRNDSGDRAPAVMARMLASGTGVAWAQVWVLVDGRLTLMASYPPDVESDQRPPPLYGKDSDEGIRTVTVSHAHRPLGVLRVRERAGRAMSPVEDRLLGGLAAQAGMVLQSAQLRAELAVRLEELTARELELRHTRDELVTAQDLERRRLERDIHDGAQQQLVALAINLKVAKALIATDPVRTTEVLREQRLAVTDAVRTLRIISGGAAPETLTQRGFAPALVLATAANPVPVRVTVPEMSRLDPDVEATLYFCALEAIQNATKHAEASRIDVRLREESGRLVLTVDDDGIGIGIDPDANTAGQGTGLSNMRERVASVGGDIQVRRSPRGTTVVADIPTAAAAPVEAT